MGATTTDMYLFCKKVFACGAVKVWILDRHGGRRWSWFYVDKDGDEAVNLLTKKCSIFLF